MCLHPSKSINFAKVLKISKVLNKVNPLQLQKGLNEIVEREICWKHHGSRDRARPINVTQATLLLFEGLANRAGNYQKVTVILKCFT